MYYPDGVIDIGLDVINHAMFLAGSTSKFTIVLRLCVCLCVSVRP